jgi:hypothetical protein
MEFSRCTQAGGPPYEKNHAPLLNGIGTVSQNSTAYGAQSLTSDCLPEILPYIEVDVISRRTESSDEDLSREIDINELGAYRDNCPGIPRKEVIQPQLPLRLPCYDFTPIINPTFDGCLPCGLAHRLRVLPTFVV